MSRSGIRKFAREVLYSGFGPWFLIGLLAIAGVTVILRIVGVLG